MLPSLSLLPKASRLWLLKLFSDTRAAAEDSMAARARVGVAGLVVLGRKVSWADFLNESSSFISKYACHLQYLER